MKPTLGYPSRTAAAMALTAQGLSVHEVAERMDVSVNNVRCLLYMRKEDRTRSYGTASSKAQRHVNISSDDLDVLTPQAHKRGIHVNELVRRLIYTIAEEGLVDSVLDDVMYNGELAKRRG